MSKITLNEGSVPATPAAGKISLYADTADGRVKAIDDAGVISSLSDATGRNLLINGGFDLAQRQVLTTLAVYSQVASRVYGPDRWFFSNENASIDYNAVDTSGTPETNLGARYYGRIRKITSTGKFLMGQVIEGINTMPLRGRYVRVQAKMRYTPNAMTVRLGLAQLANAGTIDTVPGYVAGAPSGTFVSAWGAASTDPTLGTNVALIAPTVAENGTIVGNAMNCVLTTTFVRYSAVFLVPANCKNLIPMIWTNGLPIANDILHIGEVGLYGGHELVEWTPRLISDLVPIAQRYYAKSFAQLTAPAQNAGVVGAISGIAGKAGATALAGKIFVDFPTTMRIGPLVTIYCPTEASAQIDRIDGTTPIAHTATAQLHLSEDGVFVTSTGTTNTAVGDTIALHYAADAEL